MPFSKAPEQILMKAILSLWALFMFACILNTNAENSSSKGLILPAFEFLPSGDVVRFKK
ncbi:hypothetical protein SDC9_179683 [bioreactor metagenome]|uniref:Lipoprotein n=1 Tax=bioreactor metagenome TaxID=1076179 RepID=A0A645GZK2_9ZZZZ